MAPASPPPSSPPPCSVQLRVAGQTCASAGLESIMVADECVAAIKANAETFNNAIDPQRDFNYDYFGFKTLERSYLLKVNKKIVERPQYMLMRVAIGIHKNDIEAALER